MSTFLRAAGLCGVGLLSALPGGCKRNPAPAPAASASGASASGPSAPRELSRCRRLPGYGLTLETDAPASGARTRDLGTDEPDEEDEALLPFGVDLGAAIPTASGFAVAGVRGAGQAFVALLEERASRRVDLGVVHGDVEPPALAGAADGVVVALRSSDAAGFTIKLGRIGAAAGAVQWGYELGKLGRAVSHVNLAISGQSGALVFQGEEKRGAPRVSFGRFSAQDLGQPFEVRHLEPQHDIEAPRLAARPGGYWLTWVRSVPEPKDAAKAAADAGAEDPEERELLELGLQVVEVVKLDERGEALGAPLRLGEPRRQLALFDVAPLPSGGLLVASRSDSAAPGVEGGALLLREVAPDGSLKESRLDDDEIGAGVPVLLRDADQPAEPWLAVSSPSDATRVGLVRGERTQLEADPLLGRAEVIAVSSGHFLTQRARGRAVELTALACRLSPAPSSAPAAASAPTPARK